MDTITNYKNRALASLEGNWKDAALATLFFSVIIETPVFFINFFIFNGLGSIWSLLMLPATWGFYILFLNLIRGVKIEWRSIFDGYKDWERIGITMILSVLYILLWLLLLIVPGIIKSLAYSMTPYILKDDLQIKENEALKKSEQMMEGHKMQLFLLQLSFIGWAILCIFTLGIGFFFLIPYMDTAIAHFYEDVKDEYESSAVTSAEIEII